MLGRELSEGATIIVDRREDPGPEESKVDIKIIDGPPVPVAVTVPADDAPDEDASDADDADSPE